MMHESLYGPEASLCHEHLSYRRWKSCMKPGLEHLATHFLADGTNPETLKAGRSARHSKFAECTSCKNLRKAWMDASQNSHKTAPEIVQRSYDAMLKHQLEWSNDRKRALFLRGLSYSKHASSVYECDDKCGSFWQSLPVDDSGRTVKNNTTCVFKFSIQANVVSGESGLIRLAVVPKYVTTGANFGLTNLIMCLYRAKKAGRLPSNVKTLYRHTDGGPDNNSYVTHIIHWLLVYLGIFDEVLWFRFEAGCGY